MAGQHQAVEPYMRVGIAILRPHFFQVPKPFSLSRSLRQQGWPRFLAWGATPKETSPHQPAPVSAEICLLMFVLNYQARLGPENNSLERGPTIALNPATGGFCRSQRGLLERKRVLVFSYSAASALSLPTAKVSFPPRRGSIIANRRHGLWPRQVPVSFAWRLQSASLCQNNPKSNKCGPGAFCNLGFLPHPAVLDVHDR